MRILYLIRRHSGNRDKFRNEIISFTETALCPLAKEVVVAVSDTPGPRFSVIPFRSDLVALISLEGVGDVIEWPKPPEGFAGAYRAEVAFPVVHERTWELGSRSPGAGLFTIFRKRSDIEDSEFLRRWYDGHTPLTLEVHPNAGYVRNRVTAEWTPAGPEGENWDGIVEEQYNPPEDLLKASRFFGGSVFRMLPTMLLVLKDVKGFIDYSSIHTWLTSEYRIK